MKQKNIAAADKNDNREEGGRAVITMTEIAKLTGVSQPTVSRVLNGNQAVNPEIRERVLACAREHNCLLYTSGPG